MERGRSDDPLTLAQRRLYRSDVTVLAWSDAGWEVLFVGDRSCWIQRSELHRADLVRGEGSPPLAIPPLEPAGTQVVAHLSRREVLESQQHPSTAGGPGEKPHVRNRRIILRASRSIRNRSTCKEQRDPEKGKGSHEGSDVHGTCPHPGARPGLPITGLL